MPIRRRPSSPIPVGVLLALGLVVACATASHAADLRDVPELTEADWQKLDRGEVSAKSAVLAGMDGGQAWVVLPYTPSEVYAIIRDVAAYPRWRADIKEVTSQKWIAPNVEEVSYVAHLVRTIHITLRRTHSEAPRYVWWTMKEGDIKAFSGGYNIYPLDQGETLLEYHTAADAGIWVPGFVKSAVTTSNLPSSLREFLPELERRFGHRERKPVKHLAVAPFRFCTFDCVDAAPPAVAMTPPTVGIPVTSETGSAGAK